MDVMDVTDDVSTRIVDAVPLFVGFDACGLDDSLRLS